MTDEKWAKLTSRERDALVAEKVMNYKRHIDTTNRSWQDGYTFEDTLYTTDSACARLVEDEIERRGLEEQYSEALCAICWQTLSTIKPGDEFAYVREDSLWSLIRATPEQRCLAALKAVAQRAPA